LTQDIHEILEALEDEDELQSALADLCKDKNLVNRARRVC